jgi:hypothetical protein
MKMIVMMTMTIRITTTAAATTITGITTTTTTAAATVARVPLSKSLAARRARHVGSTHPTPAQTRTAEPRIRMPVVSIAVKRVGARRTN